MLLQSRTSSPMRQFHSVWVCGWAVLGFLFIVRPALILMTVKTKPWHEESRSRLHKSIRWKPRWTVSVFICVYVHLCRYFVCSLSCSQNTFVPLSTGADLFSNCTEECKALGHSDRCWMPSFVPSDGRQGPDYRSNLHVPGMDSVPDTEVFESPEQTADKSFSTFGKETPPSHLHHHQNHHHLLKNHHLSHHQGSLERKELEAFLPSSRAPYNPAYLSEYCVLSAHSALYPAYRIRYQMEKKKIPN